LKKGIILLVVFLLVFSSPHFVNAATRAINIMPNIEFDGTDATCTAYIVGNNASEPIDATIKLWNRNRCIETWTVSGTGYIVFSETILVEDGKIYRLSVDAAFDGVMQPTVSISRTCE